MEQQTITLGIAVCGAVTGTLSLFFTYRNYRRDRARLAVILEWDAEILHEVNSRKVQERCGHIIIRNKGRRPISVDFVGLEIPGRETYGLLTEEQNRGVKLNEGDSPLIVRVPQDYELKKYSHVWKKIRATARDNNDKWYTSRWTWIWGRPSWVE